ncbi:hypothetical protein VTI74DRAFT_4913 [Chaetomium olivicolor]
MFFSKEDFSKKDDDHKRTRSSAMRSRWAAATSTPTRKTWKRLAIVLALGVFVYLFISNLPTDVPIRDRRRPVYRPNDLSDRPRPPGPMPKLKSDKKLQKPVIDSSGPPSSDPGTTAAAAGYNGPVFFPRLLPSLQAISSNTAGHHASNRNVLFVAASLKSAALLLPMACQMGDELRNYVHFALLGGSSEIQMGELLAVNGIDESCQVIFHDARPDFAATSTIDRLKLSTGRALYHINNYMHPQAIVVDTSGVEEEYFLSAIKKQAGVSGIPLIELPENASSRLAWLAKLDSSSLAAWDKVSIDILIQPGPGTSGSLIHLLKSLSSADFSAGSIPHLTIELPHDADRATTEFLKSFHWPPSRSLTPSHPRQLTLRHRIPSKRLTEEDSSMRFLELFWPASPKYSHVLVLSPQAQLSPQFFHYLKYSVLQYLYSGAAVTQEWDSRLLGISLDLPSTHLDGSKPFSAPPGKGVTREPTPFLWQAPNSNAALFTGQKWVELHALISKMLDFEHKTQPMAPFFTEKLVTKRYPSWMEHTLKLARARGYWMLYPNEQIAKNLATVHTELYRAPEEYEEELAKETPGGAESPVSGGTLFEALPGGGKLLPFDDMPLLLWDGTVTELTRLDDAAEDYANTFRRTVGGCEALAPKELLPRQSMGDLFCLKDE